MINYLDAVKNRDLRNEHVEAGLKIWSDYFSMVSGQSQEKWNSEASILQMRFENQCGGRWVGQELMAYTMYAHLYDTQNGLDNAQGDLERVKEALSEANLSIEVGGHLARARNLYEGVE